MNGGLVLLLTVGITLAVSSCQAAPVSEDVDLLTQLLKKVNIVLDNVIDKQRAERSEHEDGLKRQARWGAGFLGLICKELHLHGLHDPSCDTIGEVERPTAERSFVDETDKDKDLNRTARSHVNVISEICEVFRKHGIMIDECRISEVEMPAAERSVRDHGEMASVERPERTSEDAVDEQMKEVSEPEPSPASDNSDISLSKVLKYLQRLRSISHSKHA